ncbi:hypothetical protein ACFQQG_02885 [Halovenus salina]|uniref:Uncharacterized protein n=1 Tax=Halovenus salina TaxID=1510225 RepID=A0ABD5VXV8_9EURY
MGQRFERASRAADVREAVRCDCPENSPDEQNRGNAYAFFDVLRDGSWWLGGGHADMGFLGEHIGLVIQQIGRPRTTLGRIRWV